jgi:hypothetical protein
MLAFWIVWELSLAGIVRAQVTGTLMNGTVQDIAGRPIAEARVIIRNIENGALRVLSTDGNGTYSAPSIPVGKYEVAASKEAFETQIKKGIDTQIGQVVAVDFTLSIGELRQTVTVEEKASVVSLSTQSTSGIVNERQVKELPLNGRSYDSLLTLNPGVINYTSERSGGVGTSSSSVGNMFAIEGRRPQENLFLLNGIEFTGASVINNTPGGTSGQLLGVEAVREFNVVSNVYGAEFGKRSGGQISIITMSGTNEFHGSAYEFLRNSAWDARNFFDQGAIPAFQRNQFGVAQGGAIRKDKLFYFGNYEGFRQKLGLSDVTLVPDNAARAGYVPDSSGALKFVGIAQGVAGLLTLWPVQNGPELGGGIAETFSHPMQDIREDFGTSRFDANISSKDTFAATYTIDDSFANSPSVNPLSRVVEGLREQVMSAQYDHVFSPSVLSTARAGFSRGAYYFTGTIDSDMPGWVAGAPIGAIVVGGGTALNATSQISLAGTNAGSNLGAVRNLYTYAEQVSTLRGIHQIQAGVWFQRIQANDNLAQYQYGQASFGSLASFLQGDIATFTVVPAPTPLGWRSLETAGFVQDLIRLGRRLNVSLGFRFESTNGWNESHGRAANYAFDSSGVIQTKPLIRGAALTRNRAQFLPEPRIALAWDPFGKSTAVVHAGFGIYRSLLDNLDYRLDQVAPFNTTLALRNVTVDGLSISSSSIAPGSKISPSGIQPDAYTPTVLVWNLKIEQQVRKDLVMSLAYSGSHGYHGLLSVDANEPAPTICPAFPCPSNLAAGAVYYAPGSPLANPNVANTTTWVTSGVTSYNALQLDVSRRMSSGLQVRATYTFSKSLDNGTAMNSSVGVNAPGFVMFPLNPKLDWGLSTTDVRHATVINTSYELPLGTGKRYLASARGWVAKAAGGWTLSGIQTIQSGFPFTPQLGFNPTNNGDTRNPIRPSWNRAFSGTVITGSPNQYFNPAAFALPGAGTYGDVGRDTLTGPGIKELDLALLKNTRITERVNLQFRCEMFNVFNHANFNTPNPVVFASASSAPATTAGVITATSTTSRQVQFGLKLRW